MKPLLVTGLLVLCQIAVAADDVRLEPSANSAWIPGPDDTFGQYVGENVQRIGAALDLVYEGIASPFTGDYSQETVVAMRAPYELQPAADCEGPRIGFLLIHGLTDSPYLLKPVAASLAEQYPCALLRGVLLPGHGTVPGDTLTMQHEQWQSVTEFGVNSFRNQVESLYLVGFSTGSSLSVDYAVRHRNDELISGIVMFAPAFRASTSAIVITPYLRRVKDWLDVEADRDAVKYESFSINAAAEFYELTDGLAAAEALQIPVFMVVSGDDTTIDAAAALDFFCDRTPLQGRRMIWYQAALTGSAPPRRCQGLSTVDAADPDYRYVTSSHTAITMPPGDSHYGFDAVYRNCLHYSDPALRQPCQQNDAQTVYGERNAMDELPAGTLLRRASFNPHYMHMLDEIFCFIERYCMAPQAMAERQSAP